MQRSELRLAILTVMGVLLLGACNSFKIFHSADDKSITANIEAKLFDDPVLKIRDIHVETRNGIVTLSGTVSTNLERSAVERIANQEEGVKNVVDLLDVTPPSAMPAAEGGVQKAENAALPQPLAPPQEQSASEQPPSARPRQTHHTPAVSDQDQASAELQAYTNSVSPDAAANPTPAPTPAPTAAPAPAAAAPAPAAAAPPPVVAAPAAPKPPAPAPPTPKPQEHLTVAAGTVVTIRMIDNIDSSRNQPGEEFAATLDSPIMVVDRVVGSRGADARVRLVDAQSAGHIEGRSELQLELISVTINGAAYATKSGYYEQHGASRGTRSAETIGGGAILGALIGGILGHGRGAAIGSVAGAGAGTAVQVSTKGQQVKVPAETKLDFTLQDPIEVTMGGSQ